MSAIEIRPLRQDDTTAAVELAARAFHDDPLFVHLHPDASTRQREFAVEHAAYLKRIYLPVGLAEGAVMDRQLVGMALWLPPNAQNGLSWREWLCIPTLLRTVGWTRTRFMIREYGAFDAAWPAGKQFHYLGLIAVDAQAQGRGVGSALLQAGLDRADRDSVGVYLETGTEINLAFYRKHGFDVQQEIQLPTGPRHWAMWRPPAR
ncbi:MAG: GNAT family N-acetyltransferase [Bacteroidota bacterium]